MIHKNCERIAQKGTHWNGLQMLKKKIKFAKQKSSNNSSEQHPKVMCTSTDHEKEACIVSIGFVKNYSRSCAHKLRTQMVFWRWKMIKFAKRKRGKNYPNRTLKPIGEVPTVKAAGWTAEVRLNRSTEPQKAKYYVPSLFFSEKAGNKWQ